MIFISPDEVLVQGNAVAQVSDILDGDEASYDPIAATLAEIRDNVVGPATLAVSDSQEVTILADKSVPFIVVRKVMSLCTGEGYENVSLAVIQKGAQVASL